MALDQRAQLAQRALKDAPPEVRERLADMRRMTTALIDEVRRLVRALRPNYLEDLGLLPALEMLSGICKPPAACRRCLPPAASRAAWCPARKSPSTASCRKR